MLELHDDWVWDSWLADDGGVFHLFFLCAPRSLGNPDLRHSHARVGHATSTDLTHWTRISDAVLPSQVGYDDRAVWTGCVVRDGEGWRMFRTGISVSEPGPVQRIGCDLSPDLTMWTPDPSRQWPLEADPRWYATSDTDEHWRDPWVVQDGDGLWHMYITARVVPTASTDEGATTGEGAVGHAVSPDLATWEVRPPLSGPGRFDQLEVMQVVEVEGRWVLVFSCLAPEVVGGRPGDGGVWSIPIDGPGKPVDLARAVRLTDESVYVAKVIQDRSGDWQFLAFINQDERGDFVGAITDPVRVSWNAAGSGLVLDHPPVAWGKQIDDENASTIGAFQR